MKAKQKEATEYVKFRKGEYIIEKEFVKRVGSFELRKGRTGREYSIDLRTGIKRYVDIEDDSNASGGRSRRFIQNTNRNHSTTTMTTTRPHSPSEGSESLEGEGPRQNQGGRQAGLTNGIREILIPKKRVGLIIGKNGVTVRRIQEQSKTKITLDHHRGADYRKFTVEGSPNSAKVASNMIREILEKASKRDRENSVVHPIPSQKRRLRNKKQQRKAGGQHKRQKRKKIEKEQEEEEEEEEED